MPKIGSLSHAQEIPRPQKGAVAKSIWERVAPSCWAPFTYKMVEARQAKAPTDRAKKCLDAKRDFKESR